MDDRMNFGLSENTARKGEIYLINDIFNKGESSHFYLCISDTSGYKRPYLFMMLTSHYHDTFIPIKTGFMGIETSYINCMTTCEFNERDLKHRVFKGYLSPDSEAFILSILSFIDRLKPIENLQDRKTRYITKYNEYMGVDKTPSNTIVEVSLDEGNSTELVEDPAIEKEMVQPIVLPRPMKNRALSRMEQFDMRMRKTRQMNPSVAVALPSTRTVHTTAKSMSDTPIKEMTEGDRVSFIKLFEAGNLSLLTEKFGTSTERQRKYRYTKIKNLTTNIQI